MGTLDTKKVAAEIAQGHHDLTLIHEALAKCVRDGHRSLRWQLDVDSLGLDLPTLAGQVTDGDLTLAECELVERQTKRTWKQIDPTDSAQMAQAVLRTVVASRGGVDHARAAELVGKLTVDQVTDAYRLVEVSPADPPGEPATGE